MVNEGEDDRQGITGSQQAADCFLQVGEEHGEEVESGNWQADDGDEKEP